MSQLLAEDVEMTLDAAGLAWTRRVESWAVPATGGVSREIHVTPGESGVLIDAVLIEWDEAPPESLEALEAFLKVGERDLPGVRTEIAGTQARLVMEVGTAAMESQLGEALHAVSLGCRLLATGARALLTPDLARHYLAFQRGEPGA